jgi:hypothetical protein
MEFIKPSIIKLEEGIKLTAKFQDGETPFVETLALMLASDEDVLASRKNPSIMDQYKKIASVMDYEESIEALAFFTSHVSSFSNKLQEKMQAMVSK